VRGPLITSDVFAIPYDDKYVVYWPLRRTAFIANSSAVDFIRDLKKGRIRQVSKEKGFFVEFINDHLRLAQGNDSPIYEAKNEPSKATHITLFLTTKCNLNCIYCYASHSEKEDADMSIELAKKGLDFVCRNGVESSKPGFGVGYHGGGEPSVNWDVLVRSLSYAKKLGKKFNIPVNSTMASNGVLSDSHRRWVIQNLDGISLSIDGLPEVQDHQRPLKSGDPSSKAVTRTIEAFERANFSWSARLTVTALSVDKLAKGIEYLLSLGHPRRIVVEPVYSLGRASSGRLHVKPSEFVRAFREAKEIADAQSVPLIYSAARVDVIANRFCNACVGSFCLTPSGKVSACYEVVDDRMPFSDEFIIGHFDIDRDGFVFDQNKVKSIQDWTVESIPWCEGCFAKWHCAGDCPNLVRHAMVEGIFYGHPRCEITRALLLDQLLDKIRNNGGLFWCGDSEGL